MVRAMWGGFWIGKLVCTFILSVLVVFCVFGDFLTIEVSHNPCGSPFVCGVAMLVAGSIFLGVIMFALRHSATRVDRRWEELTTADLRALLSAPAEEGTEPSPPLTRFQEEQLAEMELPAGAVVRYTVEGGYYVEGTPQPTSALAMPECDVGKCKGRGVGADGSATD